MNLEQIHRGIKKYKKRRRIGRGPGSGHGKTASRGHKGQQSRAGASQKPTFQGGAMPLVRRIPKRGFTNSFARTVVTVNVSDLENVFDPGDVINPETVKAKSLVKARFDYLKVLGDGEITKKLKVEAHRFSASAKEKIEKAGGEVVILPPITPVEVKKKLKRDGK